MATAWCIEKHKLLEAFEGFHSLSHANLHSKQQKSYCVVSWITMQNSEQTIIQSFHFLCIQSWRVGNSSWVFHITGNHQLILQFEAGVASFFNSNSGGLSPISQHASHEFINFHLSFGADEKRTPNATSERD